MDQQQVEALVAAAVTAVRNEMGGATAARVQEIEQRLAAAQAESARAQAEAAQARQESRELRSEIRANMGGIPHAIGEIGRIVERAVSQREQPYTNLVDSRGIGRPTVFTEKEDDFRNWSRKTENYIVAGLGEGFRQILRWGADQDHPVALEAIRDEYGATEEELGKKVSQVYHALSALTETELADIVSANRFALRSCRLKTLPSSAIAFVTRFRSWSNVSRIRGSRPRQWDAATKRRGSRSGETVREACGMRRSASSGRRVSGERL